MVSRVCVVVGLVACYRRFSGIYVVDEGVGVGVQTFSVFLVNLVLEVYYFDFAGTRGTCG